MTRADLDGLAASWNLRVTEVRESTAMVGLDVVEDRAGDPRPLPGRLARFKEDVDEVRPLGVTFLIRAGGVYL